MLILVLASQGLLAQEKISGKQILQGTWKGRVVKYVSGELAIKLRTGTNTQSLTSLFRRLHSRIKQDFDKLGWGWVEVPDTSDIMALVSAVRESPLVEVAEPNFVMHGLTLPNDPYFAGTSPATYPCQWALRNGGQVPPGGAYGVDIDATNAWALTTGSPNVIIAILDSGIPMIGGSLSHPDLDDMSRIILGPNYTDDPADSLDKDMRGHGTHVMGIAAAETNNGTGIAGVNWTSKIMVIKILNQYNNFTPQWMYNGVKHAVDALQNYPGCKLVINLSVGGSPSTVEEAAVSYANQHNVAIVAAAGNGEGGPVVYPAAYSSSYPNVIAVSGTDPNDVIGWYSSAGPEVTISAPGGWGYYDMNQVEAYNGPDNLGKNIFSTEPNYPFILQNVTDCTQTYGYLGGTSRAAPFVTGTVALMLSVNPSLTPSQIRATLENSATKIAAMSGQDFTGEYGYGRLNANAAVRNLYVPQVYSTVASAVSAAVSGQTVVVSSGSYSITSSLTVPSGVTLQLNSGASLSFSSGVTFTVNGTLVTYSSLTIPMGRTMNIGAGAALKFASGASLVANGPLHVNGTSAQHVTFTATSGTSKGSWGSISISGLPASGSSLSYADVSYATSIQVTNATGVTIQNCTISNTWWAIHYDQSSANYGSIHDNSIYDCGNGVDITNYASATVNNNRIWQTGSTPTGRGIGVLSYASANAAGNRIYKCNQGMIAGDRSTLNAASSFSYMRNNRVAYCNYGIQASEYSVANFGQNPPSDYMWNSIHDNTYYNAIAGSAAYLPATLFAMGDWWGSAPPDASKMQVIGPAYLNYTSYLGFDPWAGIPLPSVQSAPGDEDVQATPVLASMKRGEEPSYGRTITSEAPEQASQPGNADSLVIGIDMLVRSKTGDAAKFFLSYVEKHPEDQSAYAFLYSAADSETTPTITRFFESLPPQAAKEHKLLLSYLYLKTGDVASAKQVNDRIIAENDGTPFGTRTKLNNFYIALNNENDPQSAALILKGNSPLKNAF